MEIDIPIKQIINILKESFNDWNPPVKNFVLSSNESPFQILIATVLSARTKDEVTELAIKRLFSNYSTPKDFLKLSSKEIEDLIYPVGFYKTKTLRILEICEILVRDYGSKVPNSLENLLKLPGVGRKTANLVLSRAFNKNTITVDTHVHRISNRLNLVQTNNPFDTEMKLKKILPEEFWVDYNYLLVGLGQSICKGISPICSRCPINQLCAKKGVGKSR